jgi:hypothetical protein
MIKYIDLLKNMENFQEIDGVVMVKTERYNNNFNFYIETSKGWLFDVEKRENDVKCYAKNKEKGNYFAISVNSVDSLLNTINDYLNPPKENNAQKNDEMDLLLKRLRNDTTEHLEKMKKTDDYDERVLETMGIIIDCLVDYVGNTEEIREIIGKRLDEAFE